MMIEISIKARLSSLAVIPTTIVSKSIPNTSSSTAAPSTVIPSGLLNFFNSLRTLTVIPIDVAVNTVPINMA